MGPFSFLQLPGLQALDDRNESGEILLADRVRRKRDMCSCSMAPFGVGGEAEAVEVLENDRPEGVGLGWCEEEEELGDEMGMVGDYDGEELRGRRASKLRQLSDGTGYRNELHSTHGVNLVDGLCAPLILARRRIRALHPLDAPRLRNASPPVDLQTRIHPISRENDEHRPFCQLPQLDESQLSPVLHAVLGESAAEEESKEVQDGHDRLLRDVQGLAGLLPDYAETSAADTHASD